MMRWTIPIAAGLSAALAGFVVTLNAVPGVIMDRAMTGIAQSGVPINAAVHMPPTDETSRRVVRPSPDILYSICLYDLREGPLAITVPSEASDTIASVSLFDANTNNFVALRWATLPGPTIYLATSGSAPFNGEHRRADMRILRNVERPGTYFSSPTETGIILYRRIMTGGVSFEDADVQRQRFSCGLVETP